VRGACSKKTFKRVLGKGAPTQGDGQRRTSTIPLGGGERRKGGLGFFCEWGGGNAVQGGESRPQGIYEGVKRIIEAKKKGKRT